MQTSRISVALGRGPLAETSAILDRADAPRAAVLLANGAGQPMEAPFMQAIAHGLVARAFTVLRFNYPYQERGGRRAPDRREVLEDAHAAAAAVLRELEPEGRTLFAGKSMGGRIASHLAAQGVACDGLVFFGFPLHAPGKRGTARAEHFAAIAQPALFLQGSRDELCDLALLAEALERWGGRATLEVLEDADHSFHVRKRGGKSDAEMREALLERAARWDAENWPD
jgi:predicted alpha/beta-hydrolase family hydrolase